MRRPNSIAEVAKRLEGTPAMPLWTPLGEFLDAFYEADSDRIAMLREPPNAEIPKPSLAYLAATAEHLCSLYGLPPPAWVAEPGYFLDSAFYPLSLGPKTEAILVAESPTSFRRRFIFTEADPLRRKGSARPVV